MYKDLISLLNLLFGNVFVAVVVVSTFSNFFRRVLHEKVKIHPSEKGRWLCWQHDNRDNRALWFPAVPLFNNYATGPSFLRADCVYTYRANSSDSNDISRYTNRKHSITSIYRASQTLRAMFTFVCGKRNHENKKKNHAGKKSGKNLNVLNENFSAVFGCLLLWPGLLC